MNSPRNETLFDSSPSTLTSMSTPPIPPVLPTKHDTMPPPNTPEELYLLSSISEHLYSQSHIARLWKVSMEYHERPSGRDEVPEFVPQTGVNAGRYVGKPAAFWTCGFFPGSLYSVFERLVRYPASLSMTGSERSVLMRQMLITCLAWSATLHAHSHRTDTHDMGFILLPALRADWELTGNAESLQSILRGAENLASRFSPITGAVPSWHRAVSKSYEITDVQENFLIIIDSMCNMDLLFFAGHHTGDKTLIAHAISHARTVRRVLIRPDGSTFHVANLNPRNGEILHQQTHQGYARDSAWSRGQAWGVLGFTQTYLWTKMPVFLETARTLADFFLQQLSASGCTFPWVPLWDFRAPPDPEYPEGLRDTSAGMIAANGLLLLHQALQGQSPYLRAALHIAHDTCRYALAHDRATLVFTDEGTISTDGCS